MNKKVLGLLVTGLVCFATLSEVAARGYEIHYWTSITEERYISTYSSNWDYLRIHEDVDWLYVQIESGTWLSIGVKVYDPEYTLIYECQSWSFGNHDIHKWIRIRESGIYWISVYNCGLGTTYELTLKGD
ncbi:MAG: hypothetical protein AYK18_15135 [Theionarchaea archaeon DG-70]|nr:MAG: hypothetical protein AYK18_15135 [Theionarchaea archaeon DG-70]